MTSRTGRCLCGRVLYEIRGEPMHIGPLPLRRLPQRKRLGVHRLCRLDEAEIRIGSPDATPTDLDPTYEIWAKRREHWLHPLPQRYQFDEDRLG